ncbi:ATP-binding protein [Hallella absiana]|uniref:ATP-binding protein n=1 Tax=Hallella absiana TaxID=2925336 RepID=UPI0021C61BE4|nr:ATP-binding protein [Hallella absiana]
MSADYKLVPYGISDFEQLRKENKYLVDKTMFFEKMERAGNFLFLVRPRRFGKSLFLDMLESYYDINQKNNFQELFKGLYVAEHPTKEQGEFLVLHLDFSIVGSDLENLYENFNKYLSQRCMLFAQKYAAYYPDDFMKYMQREDTGMGMLNLIHGYSHELRLKLYLIVDEYDNFTNNVLNVKGQRAYHELTHGTGFYRDIFKLFKPMFHRIIMLGVSPITLDDLTSGYNIALNMSLDARFNQMLGFSEEEVRQMIRYYKEVGAISEDKTEDDIIADMKPWYDNYCFARRSFATDPKMFNCDMVCYYMSTLVDTGDRPEDLVDPNTMTDYGKLKRLIEIDNMEENRLRIIHEIIEKGYIQGILVSHFPAERIMDYDNFVSLLYYYGMLTIGGVEGELLTLIIPNNNVRLQYYRYLRDEYREIAPISTTQLSICYVRAAIHGDWRPLIEFICKAYHDTTAIRQLIEGERNLQGFMNAYLTLTNYYQVAPEMEFSHGYCDFFLLPNYLTYPMVAHSYILELKYLKSDATEAEAEKQWSEAVEQIKTYAADKKLQSMLHGTTLHPIVIQIKGYDLVKYEEITLPSC